MFNLNSLLRDLRALELKKPFFSIKPKKVFSKPLFLTDIYASGFYPLTKNEKILIPKKSLKNQ
jgi:hypothetical protein